MNKVDQGTYYFAKEEKEQTRSIHQKYAFFWREQSEQSRYDKRVHQTFPNNTE